jgi:ribosomal-protein-alanine N-acetyltransferase
VRWFERQSTDPTIKMYKIELDAENHEQTLIIGVCGFTSIDMTNRRAEFSIYIGPEFQNHGFGPRALHSLLMHGFKNLGFHIIWGEVFAGNEALDSFYDLGFQKEGVRRDFYFRDGQMIDAALISIKEDELCPIQ